MLKKIESFGAKSVFLKEELLIQSLDFLEKEVGKLPQSYRNFLLHFGTSVLFDVNVFFKAEQPSPWADDNGYDSLESLYGLNKFKKEYTVFETTEMYKEDFKNQWLPIGASSGDNQIILCLMDNMYGEVWFWDHNQDPLFNKKGYFYGLTRIANSFEDFVAILESFEDENDTSGVLKVDLDF